MGHGLVRQLPLFLVILLGISAECAGADWLDDFYCYRVAITVDVPAPGQYRLDLSPEAITAWINEQSDFPFDARYFDFDRVRLVDAAGGDPKAKIDAGYRIWLGGELVVNGGFEEQKDGKPVGWQISHEAFKLERGSHDGRWCMSVTGADRNGCSQNVPTGPNCWYRFSCRLSGPAAVHPHFYPKGNWWRVLPHSYCDPHVPAAGWYERTFFFHTGDKSGWASDQVQVRMERYTGKADDISLKPCQMVFVLNADKAGSHKYLLYYAPAEGVTPMPPTEPIQEIPRQALAVGRAGPVEHLDEGLSYTLHGDSFCDLWYASPLKKVLERAPPPRQSRRKIRFAAARNESEAIQLVLRPKIDGAVTSVRAALAGPHGYAMSERCFDVRVAKYVPIRKPSAIGDPYGAPYRSTFTGRLPDPLTRFAPIACRAGDPNLVLWIDVSVPEGAPAGPYHGSVELETTGGRITVPWELNVWDFDLPARPTCRTAFQFCRYANTYLFPFHKATSAQDKYALSRAYIAEMARYKLTARSPQSAATWDPAKNSLGRFASEEKELGWAIDRLHVTGYGIGHFSGPLLGGETVESARATAKGYNDLARFLKQKGWLQDAYIQIDEPQPPHFPGVRNWIAAFRAEPDAKDVPMFAFVYDGQCYDALKVSVNILVPENNDGGNSVSPAAIARWPKDKQVWCYWTNTAHQWIDAPNLDARLWSPKTWWMGGRGMATWAVTLWWKESAGVEMKNPWEDPSTPWGNGVMAYFYPPSPLGAGLPEKDLSIVPSLRMVLARDGIEDYEYAVILERLLGESKPSDPAVEEGRAALTALRRQFRSPVAWSLSEVHWDKARARVARAIERLKSTAEQWPNLPATNAGVTIPAQQWPLRPGPRTINVSVHYPGGRLDRVNAQTGLMLSLHNWGGTGCVGTAEPQRLADALNVVTLCVDYLQSGDSPSAREPYDFGYLQALDALRALWWVRDQLRTTNRAYDDARIFACGGSGGGNVALMANKLAPRTFTCVIDMCGMKRLTDDIAFNLPGGSGLNARWSRDPQHPHYLSADAQEIRFVACPEHLWLMKRLGCTAKILTVHGVEDRPTFDHAEEMVRLMRGCHLDVEPHFVSPQDVDGKVFTTAGHALGDRTAIVLKLGAEYLGRPASPRWLRRSTIPDFDRREELRFRTSNGAYIISYARGHPVGRFEARGAAPPYPNHADLSFVLADDGTKRPLRTQADWELRSRHVQAGFMQAAGSLPGPCFRVPLDVRVQEDVQLGTLRRLKLSYQSDPDDRVPAYLFLPADAKAAAGPRRPAVLCLHQTTGHGKAEAAGLAGDPDLKYALELARRGYVTLAPDYPSLGEHTYDFAPQRGYASGTMKGIWDNIRAIDLLETRPEVDPERISVLGHSLGGHNAIFLGLFDSRVKAVVSSCGFCPFSKDDVPSWTGPRYMPRIAAQFHNDAGLVPFDFPELIAATAPRALLAVAAEKDNDFNVEGVKEAIASARPIFRLYGAETRLAAIYPPTGHAFPAEAREAAYRFLDEHLRNKP